MYLVAKESEAPSLEMLLSEVEGSSQAIFGTQFFEPSSRLDAMKLAALTWDEENFSPIHKRHVDTIIALKRARNSEINILKMLRKSS